MDRESGLPTVVDDGDAAYLQADGLIERSGTSDSFPLLDALGSVRSVTSSAGTVTAMCSYDAFGAVRSATGTAGAFGFTGEPTDATGLVYLRARTLDPATARFLQSDTIRPGGPGTLGYNLYAYATNDPTTFVDPTGHWSTIQVGPVDVDQQQAAYILALISMGARWLAPICGPLSPAVCLGIGIGLIFVVLTCALTPICEPPWVS